jgi:predicted lactoylglutathione lyase
MHKQIYVNLPVADLPRSRAFFESLGLHFEPKFSNDQGACLVIHEGSIHAMLLTQDFFRTFTSKPIADATRSTEVLVCLSCESRGEVDALVQKALAAGGTAPRAPQDHGFMYAHGFQDLDGHIWELMYMDPSAIQQ